jgi:lipid II:glycine glycyltransferase (peptidoglycan interpeptide bridge formation enzyme)
VLIRSITPEEKLRYNQVVHHPLQSWEWGEFRAQTKVAVDRIGFFQAGQLEKALQVTFHPLPAPLSGKTVGYFPKGEMPDEEQLSALKQLAEQYNAVFIKLEPNIAQKVGQPSAHHHISQFLLDHGAVAGKPLFTKYTFQLDLTIPEDQLFANLDSKTRYNVNLAHKKGVKIIEDSSSQGMETYIEILQETTERQGFYAHGPEYFRQMWQSLQGTDMLHIFHAVYEDTVVTSWIMFIFDGILYYPYGSSRSIHRNVMASNLMMWEMIRYGKSKGCRMFDMWGSLGPEPDPKHPWFGFHRFKKGYGGDLVEFIGTYDMVYQPLPYKLFRWGDDLRWKLLRLKKKLGR